MAAVAARHAGRVNFGPTARRSNIVVPSVRASLLRHSQSGLPATSGLQPKPTVYCMAADDEVK